jgi:hypothetical protein
VKLTITDFVVATMAMSVAEAVMNVFTDDTFVICHQKLDTAGPRDSWVRLGHKGLETLVEFSSLWQDSVLRTSCAQTQVFDCRNT